MLVDFREIANIKTACQAIQIRKFRQSNIFLFSSLCVAHSFYTSSPWPTSTETIILEKNWYYIIYILKPRDTINNNSWENWVKTESKLSEN